MRRPVVVVLAALIAWPSLASANGRFPASTDVTWRRGDHTDLYLGATIGLLKSEDDGREFYWICEENIGYSGDFDPIYAVDDDATIYAATFDGVRVSRDGGCSFETATEDAPKGPGRIAGYWIGALDLAPDGDLWIGTAETGLPNAVYRSTDRAQTFQVIGLESGTAWWKSLKVAPSDPDRIYVAGYQVSPTEEIFLRRSDNDGQTFETLGTKGIQLGSTLEVFFVGIDPTDADIVYLRSKGSVDPIGDRIYRSDDAGATWTEVLVTAGALDGFVVLPDGNVVAGTTTDPEYAEDKHGALYVSTDHGLTFTKSQGPAFGCLGRSTSGDLFACGANWSPDYYLLGRSPDPVGFEKVLRFHEMVGPLQCPAGTAQYDVCELQRWPMIREQFVVTGPYDAGPDVPPEDPKGCCEGGRAGAGSWLLALGVLGLLVVRRRRLA
jgi:hypothetical protein